ncbi:MAG: pyridoxal phosphate-dependent aminotransferase family protein [Phaeodactylibacter sp.]|nr:pyridoxal phosphate-dependent aminotransferase family protein [Phaeodactylibacter sp.]MCB9276258.1 pyridoxal phosphate-dependent aminotransferase family protein [Lewinellaceae bacterium]
MDIKLETIPGRVAILNGKAYRYFSGTSYLGMAQYEPFKAAVAEGVARYGVNFGGSRLGNIRFSIFEEAEAWLATFTGAGAALTASSGSVAGQLLVRYLKDKGSLYSAPGLHPALWAEGHHFNGPFEAWADLIVQECSRKRGPMVLLSNAVDPLFARPYPFEWLDRIPPDATVTLVLDDSHGLGVCGENGAGAFSVVKPPPQVEMVVVSSLGKALGVPGGVILGRPGLIQALWHSPFFGGASPIAPAFLYGMLQVKEHYPQALGRLRASIRRFREPVLATGLFRSFMDYPVFYTPEHRLGPWLETHGCLLSQFAYPTPEDEPVTRIVLNALHEAEDIDYLVAVIRRFLESLS